MAVLWLLTCASTYVLDTVHSCGYVNMLLIITASLIAIQMHSNPCTCLSLTLVITEVVNNPDNKTVFLNQPVVFTCETNGGLSGWRINGTLPGNLPPEVHRDLELVSTGTDEGTTLLKLTIPARAEYNNTRVQCLTGTFGGSSVESETAILKVQGISY